MNRLYVPTLGPTDWRRLLKDPIKHWKRHRSALEMAVSWEAARRSERGLPPEVQAVIDSTPELSGSSLLIGLPEHQVEFEGGGHPSQNDLWALLRTRDSFTSMTVEAKAGEKFDDIVAEWLKKKTPGRSNKPLRLEALQRDLGIPGADVSDIRYQLLHRTASALREARRFSAHYAVMLIQSFDELADEQSWSDFMHFSSIMGIDAARGSLELARRETAVPLYLGWVTSSTATLEVLGAAV